MLDADRVVRLLRGLRHVGRALVGDELHAFEADRGSGGDLRDELGGLALVDREGIEQVALAIAEVLHADELEVDAEHAQIGGVAAELRVRRGHAEIEPTRGAVVGWWRRRRWRSRRR